MTIAQLFFKKGNFIGDIELDIIIREGATATSEATKNPVEKGADINDHIVIRPMEFEAEGFVSNISTGIIPALSNITSTFTKESCNAEVAWTALLELQASRIPFDLVQGLKTYENVYIKSLRETQDKDSSNGLNFVATFGELNIVGISLFSLDNFSDQDISDSMIPASNGGLKQASID
ncbi:MAG: hypothetical protein GY861_24420 [bacterium]|nr:hypothetical protein [bacterium]